MLGACGSPGEPAPEPAAPRPVPAPSSVRVPSAPVGVGDAEAVSVELQFQGVGDLFRGFFVTPELVAQLGRDLGSCVRGGLAVVVITWSDDTRIGAITLKQDPEMVGCPPVVGGDAVDLAPLEPIGRALARYRDGVSGRYDLRVASFRVGVQALKGLNHCTFWAGGQYPPDGSRWKRCVDLAGAPRCMDGDRHEGVVALRLDAADLDYVRGCFASP